MQLRKRLEKLEAKTLPAKMERWHLVEMAEGETREEAIASHHEPITAEDSIVFLVPVAPRFNPDGSMLFYSDWPENQPGCSG